MPPEPESSAPVPSLTDALIPLITLVVLLALSVKLYGADSSYGANQIVLLLCACLAAAVGMKNGASWDEMQEGMVHGIGLAFKAILILLTVGSLIGSWILAGVVPAMIYYGLQIFTPDLFYATACFICALVGISIGSSWTVAGTLGIGLMGIAGGLGLSPMITAGAIISGAYFGDKLSPLSDTTNLAAAITGNELFQHIRHMLWTTLPSIAVAFVAFLVLGAGVEARSSSVEVEQVLAALKQNFSIGWYLLIPLVILLVMAYLRVPAFPTLIFGSLVGCLFAAVFQQPAVVTLAGADSLAYPLQVLKGVWYSLFDGYKADTDNAVVNELLSKGGMSSMMNTIWLIISAMAFGGVMERTGSLQKIVTATLAGVRSTASLIATTVATCFGMNAMAGDQYMAIILPGRMLREKFAEQGLQTINLSRTLEDAGTLTSVLIPWNTCGAFMSATLGIATWHYAPYAIFNYVCPLIAIAYGVANVRLPRTSTPPPSEVPERA
ncbi:Na+/H+ antiporter NhaC [Exilibacterium tricleocarpae]|uniref:Na+/H+ antiporter NhaC n=1 Tax=Exilibacterium tricleocarpae TaxID=2591008 RepID=A0A545STJ1_9GAMM|nr:Na+/H+ antiporter NhaC [Exilibacterium tricleocarpae]TQV68279.1 Na+/H+ antiporter NhaC [Exilibacterium tricleocarpae]